MSLTLIHHVTLHRDTYVDSVVQLAGTRAARAVDGVEWATAAMGTPGNLEILAGEGFDGTDGAGANDLVVAVRAASDEVVDAARAAAETAMFSARDTGGPVAEAPPRTLRDAVGRLDGAKVAVVSVPGDYAALEAHKALSAGLDVLLFSDNVSVEAEVALKERAGRLDRLVMGPGAGTAMVGGTCLGFANVVATDRRPGVAVVAAAGTGAQEAAALLDRWGAGVPHVIGLGGRDLTAAVGGRMAHIALRALAEDPRTDVVLLVSKPPAPEVAASVLGAVPGTPLVAALIGLEGDAPAGATVTRTLEAGVMAALRAAGLTPPDVTGGLAARAASAAARLGQERTLVRGLFSGGTLCYESLVLLGDLGIDTHSNTPIDKRLGLPAPAGAHQCLDLGEEEYTKGRPHPMIDPAARIALLREHGAEPDVAAIVLDVVLGHGANLDPAAELAPVCREIAAGADGAGPVVVVYVLGTEQDPQGLARTRAAFTDAGCLVTETAARATLAAAAVATRRPELAERAL